jgi:hypothetical protein
MIKEDLKDFTVFFMAIAEVYGKKLSDTAVLIYFDALKDLDFTVIKRSVKAHCEDPEDGKFMPLPAHIRGRSCRPEKTSIIAWRQVEDAYCRFNYYDSVQFEDGTINAVIKDMGGWTWFSSQNLDEPWTQKEFERRYQAYKGQRIELQEVLPGFHELTNRNGGYIDHIPETKLILESGEIKLLAPCLPKELPPAQNEIKLLSDKLSM